MGSSIAQSFGIIIAFLVGMGATRVAFPDAGRANPAGEAEEVATPRSRPEWTLTFIDPNVIDADSYGSSTAIFIDSRDRPNFIYAKGPVGIDDWRFSGRSSRRAVCKFACFRRSKLRRGPLWPTIRKTGYISLGDLADSSGKAF